MHTQHVHSEKWDSIASSVQQKYSQITDEDLQHAQGDPNRLAAIIQQKTGQSRAEIESFFDECCESSGSIVDQVNEMASEAGQSIRQGYDQAAEQARRGYDTTVKTMSRRPLESAGVALGVGLVVGLLFGISIGAHQERQLSWRDRWSRS